MLSRRRLLAAVPAALAGAAVAAPFVARAQDAEFAYKYANNLPDAHPMNVRAKERRPAIKKETDGRVDIQVFPNNQLGSDTDMLSQLRSGAIEFFTLSGLILSTLVPAPRSTASASPFRTTPGVDGDGRRPRRICPRRRSPRPVSSPWTRSGTTAFARSPPRPSRSVTPDDLNGFKIRVPVSPLWTSMFKAFGAAPTHQLHEVYSSLQTRVVDGQENPLAIIATAKLYEVQKYCSLTNHMWDGFWFLANRRAWEACRRTSRPSCQEHQRRGRHGARGRRQAQRAVCSRTRQQGTGVHRPSSAPFRDELRRPASTPNGKASSATKRGRSRERSTGKLA